MINNYASITLSNWNDKNITVKDYKNIGSSGDFKSGVLLVYTKGQLEIFELFNISLLPKAPPIV